MGNDWKISQLGSLLFSVNDKSKQVKSTEYSTVGTYPIVDQSADFICGYHDDVNKVINSNLPVTVFGDHTRHTKFVSFPFIAGADGTQLLRPLHNIDDNFFYYLISYGADKIGNYGYDRHFKHLKDFSCSYPTTKPEQTKIAEILSTVDRAIEQTEALIAKQQRIKTGLMQDLLTRGIDEHGNLRSEATHEFKDSPLGRIPVEWEVKAFGDLVVSATDGPFGSNLKTEHYVNEPGVRVLRLQNIGNGVFIDDDKAWVSCEHAAKLQRHIVEPYDLLIGSLGDDNRLLGRACLYPETQQIAIVKADVFRIRCKPSMMLHQFAFRLLNFPRWRKGLYGLAQGVTRDRVNLSNLMKLDLPVPNNVSEQQEIAKRLDSSDSGIKKTVNQLSKLRSFKTALMQDLLTGKVRVTPLLEDVT